MSLYSSLWGIFLDVGLLHTLILYWDLGVPLPWFFIITSFFIINHVYIIILECYPGWLPSQTCWPSRGTFLLSRRIPQSLSPMRLGRCCCHSIHGQICGAVLRCGAVSLCHICLFRSRRPFIIGGPFRIVCNIYSAWSEDVLFGHFVIALNAAFTQQL